MVIPFTHLGDDALLPPPPPQKPCPWCLDEDKTALLVCQCNDDCGCPDCPYNNQRCIMDPINQPVPRFI